MNGHFTKENIRITNKHVKRCSIGHFGNFKSI